MKNFYILLSAACVAVSANAAGKDMVTPVKMQVNANSVNMANSPVKFTKTAGTHNAVLNSNGMVKAGAKAPTNGEYAYYRAEPSAMALGLSTNGYGYQKITFGFLSSNAPVTFYNYSTGVKAFEWNYADVNDFEQVGQSIEWNFKTSDAQDLVVNTTVGEMASPELYVTYDSGTEGMYTRDYLVEYICGGSGNFWFGEDELGGEQGVTFYQNCGMVSPQDRAFAYTYKTSYDITDKKNYNANGVYVGKDDTRNWQATFDARYETTVQNLAIDNFTFIQPTPASPYMITKGWNLLQVTAKSATQLTSYIYPIDEEGYITDTAIAQGFASISKGDNPIVVFEYVALNEDGDETEEDIFIDSAVAVTVEGFAGNNAISSMSPSSGYYPFSYTSYSGGNYDICPDATMYIQFSMDVNGENVTTLAYDNGLYYFDQADKNRDEDTLSLLSYGTFFFDATYPFIYAPNGEKSLNIPLAGGECEVDVNALYYNISALLEMGEYTLTAPEWLTVTFGQSSQQTGITTMTVVADACEAPGRSGVITLEGLGAKFNLEVVQGEGGAVNVVVADGDSQYFDLAGRRVANPDKGIYIKKAGNKAEKVVF